MTDIDPGSDIKIVYQKDDLDNLIVVIPLAGEVSATWQLRYEAMARAKGIRARASGRDGVTVIHLTVPVRAAGEDVLNTLDAARVLLAEVDAVEQSPATSSSPEAIARRWWASQ